MPDKRYKPGCGGICERCWRNKLKHANPQVKKYMKKYNIKHIDLDFNNKVIEFCNPNDNLDNSLDDNLNNTPDNLSTRELRKIRKLTRSLEKTENAN